MADQSDLVRLRASGRTWILLCAENGGGEQATYNVANDKVLRATDTASYVSGHIGFGSWATAVEFKDFKWVSKGHRVDVPLGETTRNYGSWSYTDGVLSQTSLETGTQYILKGFKDNDYTLECKARRVSGKEGFLIYFGMTPTAKMVICII